MNIKIVHFYWISVVLYFLLYFSSRCLLFMGLTIMLSIVIVIETICKNKIINIIGAILQICYAAFFLYISIFRSFINQDNTVLFFLVLMIINVSNLFISIVSLYLFIGKPKSHINTSLSIKFAICSLIIFLLMWSGSFYSKERYAYKYISTGKKLVEEIETFKQQYNRLPDSLDELSFNYNEEGILYEIDSVSQSYILMFSFEHWFNRRNKNIRIMSQETVIYDSQSKKWTHEY